MKTLKINRLFLGTTIFCLCFGYVLDLSAQEWAQKLFTGSRSHDFGVVAKDSKTEHRFEIANPYIENVVIDSVVSSCVCSTPRIEKRELQTYEKGAIIVRFNTDRVIGSKNATITVRISKPFPAIVELQICGYVRSDIFFTPKSAGFGTIPPKTEVSKTVFLKGRGRSNWGVTDVKSNNPNITGELINETGIIGGEVDSEIKITVKDTMPVGYFKEQIVVITNDKARNEIPLLVEGVVHSDITVSPSTVFLGNTSPDAEVRKQVVVRGSKPFSIKKIECKNPAVQITEPVDMPKSIYILPIVFKPTADSPAGKLSESIEITTDSETSLTLTLLGEIEK